VRNTPASKCASCIQPKYPRRRQGPTKFYSCHASSTRSEYRVLNGPKIDSDTEVPVIAWTHRINDIALSSAIGNKEEAKATVFYVCGPPDMTDEVVAFLKEQQNVVPEHVLCEKWW
jgi:hypothetical protein